jgi:hypothetical protein
MAQVTFTFPDKDRTIDADDARWLIGQLRSGNELSPAAGAAATKLDDALAHGSPIEITLAEKQELVDAFERGSGKPRSSDLRRLEVELRTTLYADRYFRGEGGGGAR